LQERIWFFTSYKFIERERERETETERWKARGKSKKVRKGPQGFTASVLNIYKFIITEGGVLHVFKRFQEEFPETVENTFLVFPKFFFSG